jgi:hypothetical protein
MMRVDPLDSEVEAGLILALADKSFRILMHQMMFALAYEDLFGAGNQEAFFRLVKDYNKTASPGKHLGPKKFSSPKSLRAYLKKGRAHIPGSLAKFYAIIGSLPGRTRSSMQLPPILPSSSERT